MQLILLFKSKFLGWRMNIHSILCTSVLVNATVVVTARGWTDCSTSPSAVSSRCCSSLDSNNRHSQMYTSVLLVWWSCTLLFRLMKSYKNTPSDHNMGTGLFLEADSFHLNTTVNGWKEEERKGRKGEEEMSRMMREHLARGQPKTHP